VKLDSNSGKKTKLKFGGGKENMTLFLTFFVLFFVDFVVWDGDE
jgi:hypothetical protein